MLQFFLVCFKRNYPQTFQRRSCKNLFPRWVCCWYSLLRLIFLFRLIIGLEGVIFCTNLLLTLKRLGDQTDPSPCGFTKNIFSRERANPRFSVTFNIIISHIIPKNVIEIPQIVQKTWRFLSSTLTFFVYFPDIFTFPGYKKTNEVSICSWCQHFLPSTYCRWVV